MPEMICFSLPESAQKARMPSASFSEAIWSSLSWKRKVFSSCVSLMMPDAGTLSALSLRSTGPSVSASFCSRSGLMVSRSQPVSYTHLTLPTTPYV